MLSALRETINIMTLGGLALAVGILVDDATVEIENINRNLAQGKETVRAILDGAQQIAVPALVSTLCICIVFVPMFFLTGVAQVPVRAAGRSRGLRHAGFLCALANAGSHDGDVSAQGPSRRGTRHRQRHLFSHPARLRARLRAHARGLPRRLWPFASITPGPSSLLFLLFCLASAPIALVLGRDFFPRVDAGLIRLHMRARAGQRVEETARECDEVDNLIRRVIPPEDLGNVLDNIGLFNSTINTTYSNSGVIGESDAEILIGLKPERTMPTQYYVDRAARAAQPSSSPARSSSFSPPTSSARF